MPPTSATTMLMRRRMRRSGLTMSAGCRSPAATSCSIGVKRMKFSRQINTTSASPVRARVLSKCIAAYRPANPPLAITILGFACPMSASNQALGFEMSRAACHEHGEDGDRGDGEEHAGRPKQGRAADHAEHDHQGMKLHGASKND